MANRQSWPPATAARSYWQQWVSAGDSTPEWVHREVPQNRAGYPSMETFGVLPAHGLFARDVDDLRLERLVCRTLTPDRRPAVAWQHCHGVTLHDLRDA